MACRIGNSCRESDSIDTLGEGIAHKVSNPVDMACIDINSRTLNNDMGQH